MVLIVKFLDVGDPRFRGFGQKGSINPARYVYLVVTLRYCCVQHFSAFWVTLHDANIVNGCASDRALGLRPLQVAVLNLSGVPIKLAIMIERKRLLVEISTVKRRQLLISHVDLLIAIDTLLYGDFF